MRLMMSCGLLMLVSGCSGGTTPSWLNASSWFGRDTVAKDLDYSQISKGPPAVPDAAPVPPVQAMPLPAPSIATQPPVSAQAAIPPQPYQNTSVLQTGSENRVAILLPLSGKNAALGQAMLNAAQQAIFDIAPPNFKLMPRDTARAGQDQVDVAVRDVVASKAQLIIGPVFAAQVPTARMVAQSSGINMLTLSTDTSLAAPGLYVMGFTPQTQVERVVHYALDHGVRRIAALVPNNPYGNIVGHELQATVQRSGGSLVALETYDSGRRDTQSFIQQLAVQRNNIDAIFLPASGPELNTILHQLTNAGFDFSKTRLLGTGLWDAVDFILQNPGARGGWYAAPDPLLRRRFVETYQSTYGQFPPRLVTLAYDATALAAVLAKRGTGYDQSTLTNPNGFAGLDGIFRLSQQGVIERGLAVLEVTPNGPQIIDPAPTTFAGQN
jgi:hypothetical protein